MLQGQRYQNCIRTEKGYCAIQWKQSSTTSPDPFQVGASPTTAVGADGTTCAVYIFIPSMSPDGIKQIPVPPGTSGFQSQMCGIDFGIEGSTTGITQALVTRKQPFILGVYTDTTTSLTPAVTGFNLDYTQIPC
jgi:hypothetical protein